MIDEARPEMGLTVKELVIRTMDSVAALDAKLDAYTTAHEHRHAAMDSLQAAQEAVQAYRRRRGDTQRDWGKAILGAAAMVGGALGGAILNLILSGHL